MKHVMTTSYVKDLFFMDVSIQSMSPYIWEDAHGFDVDSRWGTFCMAGESLLAMLQPRSSVIRHAGRICTYGRIVYARGVSELEAEERQYFIRQESGCKKRICHVGWNQQQPAAQI